MAGQLQPLDEKFAIVGPDGRPTLYFIKWAQQRQIDITAGLTLEQLVEYLDAHELVEGSGIQIVPSGSLNDSPTISADAQEILDQISTTRGTILYRNASDWVGLPPDTAGKVLQTNGAGADPSWVTPAAGGGATWTEITFYDFAVSGATAAVTANVTPYNDALVVFRDASCVANAIRAIQVSYDNGATWSTGAADYAEVAASGAATGRNSIGLHTGVATAARYSWGLVQALRSTRAAKPVLCPHTLSMEIIGATSPVTNVRAVCWTGAATSNFAGGTVSIYGR